jgi:hypothetical protein
MEAAALTGLSQHRGMVEMASSAAWPKIEQRCMQPRRLPAGAEGLGHGGQHTIAVTTTVMC